MTASSEAGATAARRWRPLDSHPRRVLGVLIEKAKTTPAGYPMTVNAIVAGCNQKNNRDPVTALDETDVENALHELSRLGVVAEIDWVGRVPKYKHLAYEWLGVGKAELAVLAELLLRGAQAVGELRGRAARMEPIVDLAELKPIVAGLLERGLMVELTPPGRGQLVTHNLYPAHELAEVRARLAGAPGTPSGASPPPGAGASRAETPVSAHERGPEGAGLSTGTDEIRGLRAEIAELRERVRQLEVKLAPPRD